MNAREAYNQIIADIEEGAANEFIRADELADAIINNTGLPSRVLNGLIQFMTGETLLNYIKTRKMMHAYKSLFDKQVNGKFRMSRAVEISGLDNESSFSKKFRVCFRMSPQEARKKTDMALFVEPCTWERVSDDSSMVPIVPMSVETDSNTDGWESIISTKYLRELIHASELDILNNLPSFFIKLAIELKEKQGMLLREALRFVDSIFEYGGEFKADDLELAEEELAAYDPVQEAEKIAFDPCMQFFFFQCNLSVSTANILMFDYIPYSAESVMLMDPDMLHAYAYVTYLEFNFFKKAYEYFYGHGRPNKTKKDFYKFLQYLDSGHPIETAFDYVFPSIDTDLDFYLATKPYFYDNESIEEMAQEIESWNGIGLDDEYQEYRLFGDE